MYAAMVCAAVRLFRSLAAMNLTTRIIASLIPPVLQTMLRVSENADVIYKCTDYYQATDERGSCGTDPISAAWRQAIDASLMSEKDQPIQASRCAVPYIPVKSLRVDEPIERSA